MDPDPINRNGLNPRRASLALFKRVNRQGTVNAQKIKTVQKVRFLNPIIRARTAIEAPENENIFENQ